MSCTLVVPHAVSEVAQDSLFRRQRAYPHNVDLKLLVPQCVWHCMTSFPLTWQPGIWPCQAINGGFFLLCTNREAHWCVEISG